MRGAGVVLAIALAICTIGCDTAGGRTYSALFPAVDGDPDGTVDLAALPLRLHDQTGTVTGVEIVAGLPDDLMEDLIGGRVTAIPDRPDVLRVAWIGGACERAVAVRFAAEAGGFSLAIDADDGIRLGGCPAVGIGRAVVIGFTHPIEPVDVFVTVSGR